MCVTLCSSALGLTGPSLRQPNDPNNALNNNTIVPFPADPTTSFHNYTIAWLNHTTQYYFDDSHLKSPVGYCESEPVTGTKFDCGIDSYNPSYLYLNNWSDADPAFTLGPPKTDVVMQG